MMPSPSFWAANSANSSFEKRAARRTTLYGGLAKTLAIYKTTTTYLCYVLLALFCPSSLLHPESFIVCMGLRLTTSSRCQSARCPRIPLPAATCEVSTQHPCNRTFPFIPAGTRSAYAAADPSYHLGINVRPSNIPERMPPMLL